MHPRRLGIALLCFSALIAAVVLTSILKPDHSFAVRVINTTESGASRDVTVEFHYLHPPVQFNIPLQMQARVAGHWQSPKDCAGLGSCDLPGFPEQTNCEYMTFSVPAQADACRLSLDYTAGVPRYCQRRAFLTRHGLYQKFQKTCDFLLQRVGLRLRHAECELSLPPEAHEKLAATN